MKKTIKTTKMKKMSNGGQKDPGKGGRIAGLATTISGAIGVGTKMLSDAIKKRRAVVQGAKELRKANPNLKKKEAIKASRYTINNPTPEAKRGGSVKSKTKKK
jgi:hypothetical protein